MNMDETVAYLAAYRAVALKVAEYLRERSAFVEQLRPRATTPNRDVCLLALWRRAFFWSQTLTRLDRVLDIQAVSVANRTLIELAVDALLIMRDESDESGLRFKVWAESERLKFAETLVAHFDAGGAAVPAQYEPLAESLRNEKPEIDGLRRRLWPVKGKPDKAAHPQRWTGRDLFADIVLIEKDGGLADFIRGSLRRSLSDYYREEYRQLCWATHSGLAGVWSQDDIAVAHYFMGTAFLGSADFAFLCHRVVMLRFVSSLEELGAHQAEWDALLEEMARIVAAAEAPFLGA
jgi:hypothetical protein